MCVYLGCVEICSPLYLLDFVEMTIIHDNYCLKFKEINFRESAQLSVEYIYFNIKKN